MQRPKHVQAAFVAAELQHPVKVIVQPIHVMLQTASANVARWTHVFHHKPVLPEPALVINSRHFTFNTVPNSFNSYFC